MAADRNATWVKVGGIVGIATLLLGSAAWSFDAVARASAVETKVEETRKQLDEDRKAASKMRDEYRQDVREIRDYMQSLDQRTARIEGKLDRR